MKKGLLMLVAALLLGLNTSYAVDLWVRGATPGWNAQPDSEKMTQDGDVYTKTFSTLSGEFKIATITANGGWDDNYNFGPSAKTNVELGKTYDCTVGNGAQNFNIPEAFSNVTISFNISTKKMTITGEQGQVEISYGVHGNFSGSWADLQFTEDKTSGIWSATVPSGSLTGEFGLRTWTNGGSPSWSSNGLTISEENPEIELPVGASGGGNNKFVFTAGKTYTLSYDPKTSKLKLTWVGGVTYPEKLFVIGTVNGKEWNYDNGVEMTAEGEGVYTVKTAIMGSSGTETGGFSFTDKLGTKADWSDMGTRYGATANDTPVTFTDNIFTAPIQGGEYSFSVAAGTYSFTVSLKDMTVTVKADSVTPPDPEAKFYVIGNMEGVSWTLANALEMTGSNNTYTYTCASLPAGTEFKILKGNENWDGKFGAEGNPADTVAKPVDVTLGTAMNAWGGSECNFRIAKAIKDVTITFAYSAEGASRLTVTGTEEVTPDPARFYVVGSMDGVDWDAAKGYEMTAEGNEYTYTCEELAAGIEFKIVKDKSWDAGSWGADGEGATGPVNVTLGTAMKAWKNSACNFKIVDQIHTVKIKFTYNETDPCSITVDGTVGISEIDAENAKAVYYNLQGVQVENPANGLYIKVRNGKSEKVIVK